MTMRVALLNLGESPRIFHNRLNKPVSVPVGKITIADLDGRVVQGLKFPSTPETLLVGEEGMTIPPEVSGIIDLLAVVEFEDYETLMRRFLEVAPPNNLGPGMRPSRQQIRQMLRTMVEDWVAGQRDRMNGVPIHDDKAPAPLEDALREQEQRRQDPDPEHPFKTEKDRRARGESSGRLMREAPPIAPPAPRPPPAVSTAAKGGQASPKAKKTGKRRRG